MANTYNKGKTGIMDGSIQLLTDTIQVLLLKDSAPAYDKDLDFVADLVPGTNEISVGGYSRQTLAGKAVTENDTLDRAEAEATKAVFTALVAGQTVGRAVVYKFVTNDADSILIGDYDVVDTPTNGVDFEIRFDGVDGEGDFLRGLDA